MLFYFGFSRKMSNSPNPTATEAFIADRFTVRCEVLRLSAQPSGSVLFVQFLLDCGVAALFAWQYSVRNAAIWIALIAVTTAYRAFFPQRLPDPLTRDNLPGALRLHTLRIAVHEGAHGAAGILLFDPANPTTQLMIGVVVMAMTLSSVFSVSYFAPAMQLAITLLLAPVIAMGVAFGAPAMVSLALLGIGLLAMVWRLVGERARQLEENIGLRHNESTLREQAMAGLRQSQQAQAERLRFFSAANHDLRQPVMAMGLQAEVLRHQLEAGEDQVTVQNTLAALSRAQQALEGLTNQLLEIGRIEAAADPISPVAIALAPLLNELARQTGTGRVRVRCPDDAVVWTDVVTLRRILGNLVDNALKFTPRGRVLLACRRRVDGWRIEVRDSGIGIAPEAQDRVFGDFEQIGNVERNLQRGHGLGLAIVRRLALRLGVQITLRSAPGRGSVFGFELPAAPKDAPITTGTGLVAEAAATAQDAAPLRPDLSVLIVEDNTVVADSIAALLRLWGARAHVCASAVESLALTTLAGFDIALCDIRLPGSIDGITLAKELQRRAPKLSIALVSADIDDATQDLASLWGWQALRKPVQPAALRTLLVRMQG
ncbi:hybrid sensor histidine kinase/response regulator [Variovorax sp. Sphag1AA]|uniref:ATP-binding response regulator n=1 Tax=Variovorax sp. Sphag1AA TaxID=2587027 RepID=UPI0018377063|nr:hybrid sensor histidine kinase/response regulator [Variovorax sp. Sphag1AA]MBB3180722.1 signal transduction histidine kinase/CheY-like chemotaxis protein [Variovorax sp. Sphag1AA]